MATINLSIWKAQAKAKLATLKEALPRMMRQDAPLVAYGTLAAFTLWPLVEAAQRSGDLWAAMSAAAGVVGSVGANLVSNLVQKKHDEAQAALFLFEQVEKDEHARDALDKIINELQAVKYAQAGLSKEDREWLTQSLRQAAAQIGSKIVVKINTRGGTYVGRDLTVRANKATFVFGEGKKTPAQLRHDYLSALSRMANVLPLGVFDVKESNPNAEPTRVSLCNVYRALDTTAMIDRPASEKKQRREASPVERDQRPLRALEAVFQNPRVALLGEPGSGKSTFAQHLVYCLAVAQTNKAPPALKDFWGDWRDRRAKWLPVRVILRDFDAWLQTLNPMPTKAEPRHLRDFMTHALKPDKLDFANDLIDDALFAGRAFVVLDGLDEVTSVRQRQFVAQAIDAFIALYHELNRYLLTCRTYSYQPPAEAKAPDLRVSSFDETFELAPFDSQKIEAFIKAWYDELVTVQRLQPGEADEKRKSLSAAWRKPDLQRLARNPLQLTLMAWVNTSEKLPDKRAQLYDRAVSLLLWEWESKKRSDATQTLEQLAGRIGNGRNEIKRVLAEAAFNAHARLPAQARDGERYTSREALADVSESELKAALAGLKIEDGESDENWARDVVKAIRERSGLLTRRLGDNLTFPHRTFQEYLAGAHLIDQDDFDERADKLIEGRYDVWHGVILLAVGKDFYVGEQNSRRKPRDLVETLLRVSHDKTDAMSWRRLLLAANVLVEVEAHNLDKAKALVEDTRPRLRALMRDPNSLPPPERAEAGQLLARLGDPRLEATSLDHLQFCLVPHGPFILGSDRAKDDMAFDDELYGQRYDVTHDYYIGHFPITNAQFRVFVDDPNGYGSEAYWPEAKTAGIWRDGKVYRSVYYFEGNELKKQPESEQGEGATTPHDFGEPYNLPNHPVVGVSWYEALAFTRWLTDRWRNAGRLPEGWIVALPTEVEWEKAARGGLQIPDRPMIAHIAGVGADGRPPLQTIATRLDAMPTMTIRTTTHLTRSG